MKPRTERESLTPDELRNAKALLETSRFERDMRAKYGPDFDLHMTSEERKDYETIAGRVDWKLACETYEERKGTR